MSKDTLIAKYETLPVVAQKQVETFIELMDFLLTWNCRHINNHHIRVRLERACAAFGLVCPDICTPAELMKL